MTPQVSDWRPRWPVSSPNCGRHLYWASPKETAYFRPQPSACSEWPCMNSAKEWWFVSHKKIERYLGCSELSVPKMHSPCVSKFQNTLVLCAVPRELSLVKNLQQCIYAHYCLLNVCTVQVTNRPLLRRVVFCKQNSLLTTHKRLLKHHKCKQIKTSVLCTAWSATSSCKKFACYHKLRKLCGPSN